MAIKSFNILFSAKITDLEEYFFYGYPVDRYAYFWLF